MADIFSSENSELYFEDALSVEGMSLRCSLALAALRLLFGYDADFFEPRREFLNQERAKFVRLLSMTLTIMLEELQRDINIVNQRWYISTTDKADVIDGLNALAFAGEGKDFAEKLEYVIFDALQMQKSNFEGEFNANTKFLIAHAVNLAAVTGIFREYLTLLQKSNSINGVGRVRPEVAIQLQTDSFLSDEDIFNQPEKLRQRSIECDPFSHGRAFRWQNGRFYLADSEKIRDWDHFFGYAGVKNKFEQFYSEFSSGTNNLPLLICGLPGQGKTHFSISCALKHEDLTLILPEPENLEDNFEDLIRFLKSRPNHKFVIFFDDIEPDRINWYYFRTHVGGSMTLPSNICIVIASNYEFPVNIVSRGYGIKFPIFDEIRCQEMISDYLNQHGMRHNNERLCSVMAADYLEEFGQRKFDELSPRTLVRYLDIFDRDRNKRSKMVESSRNELITRPDPQMFFEFNLKILKSLYGKDFLDEMLRERLKNLEG